MALGQNPGLPLGPSMSIGTLVGSRDIFVSEYPWHEEMVNLHEDSRDQSTDAVALNASGLILLSGLAIYESSTGYYAPIGHTVGNSPAISPAEGVFERPFGILVESVDMRDRDGVAQKTQARILTGGGHLKWEYFHDMYGNQNNIIHMFENPANLKYWKKPAILWSLGRFSPGAATP